jgi:succinate dehydrogenase / fumarate reductase iron-sulfur subunit
VTGSKVSASGWREGICGTCGITVNGRPHGPVPNTTTCQQHVRSFKHGQTALDFAVCIGCGACVAACPNGSGNLFTGAKLAHLSLLPHGQQEREHRAQSMGAQADEEFGHCTLFGECAQVCPAEIPITAVAALNHERLRGWLTRNKMPDDTKRLTKTANHGAE